MENVLLLSSNSVPAEYMKPVESIPSSLSLSAAFPVAPRNPVESIPSSLSASAAFAVSARNAKGVKPFGQGRALTTLTLPPLS